MKFTKHLFVVFIFKFHEEVTIQNLQKLCYMFENYFVNCFYYLKNKRK